MENLVWDNLAREVEEFMRIAFMMFEHLPLWKEHGMCLACEGRCP
jgi:hypothetical protein